MMNNDNESKLKLRQNVYFARYIIFQKFKKSWTLSHLGQLYSYMI